MGIKRELDEQPPAGLSCCLFINGFFRPRAAIADRQRAVRSDFLLSKYAVPSIGCIERQAF